MMLQCLADVKSSVPVCARVSKTLNPRTSKVYVEPEAFLWIGKRSWLFSFEFITRLGISACGGTMDTSSRGEGVERQIQVRFVTKLPPALRVVTSAFAIPAKLGRYGLSEVVNTLLGLGNDLGD